MALRALIAIISAMIFRNMILVLALISSIVRGNMPLSSYTMLFGFLLPLVLGFLLFRLTVSKNGEKMANNMNNLGSISPLNFEVALKALLAFAIILMMTTIATKTVGTMGVIGSSIVGGLVSAEAVIFTTFSLASANTISISTATMCALCTTLTAILNKLIFTKIAGADKKFIRSVL